MLERLRSYCLLSCSFSPEAPLTAWRHLDPASGRDPDYDSGKAVLGAQAQTSRSLCHAASLRANPTPKLSTFSTFLLHGNVALAKALARANRREPQPWLLRSTVKDVKDNSHAGCRSFVSGSFVVGAGVSSFFVVMTVVCGGGGEH